MNAKDSSIVIHLQDMKTIGLENKSVFASGW
jgi:hypothetical protein